MSYVCLLLRPEMMESIIQFAGRRCERVVIMDDLSNINGEFVVTRRHYFLHPYRLIFERHGFDINTLIFAEKPDPAFNGILEAENRIFATH